MTTQFKRSWGCIELLNIGLACIHCLGRECRGEEIEFVFGLAACLLPEFWSLRCGSTEENAEMNVYKVSSDYHLKKATGN